MKRLLIVVDYQKDFVDGALGFPGAEALDGPIAEKIAAYRAAGDDVAFTLDTHGPGYAGTQEGKKLPVPHCIKGEPGWRLYGRTAGLLQSGDPVFEKPAFPSLDLGEWLSGRGLRRCGAVRAGVLHLRAVQRRGGEGRPAGSGGLGGRPLHRRARSGAP